MFCRFKFCKSCLRIKNKKNIINNIFYSIFEITTKWMEKRFSTFKKQPFSDVLQNMDVLKNFAIFIEKHLYWDLFLIKLQDFRPVTLWKRDSNIGAFLWILRNFFSFFHRAPLVAAFDICSFWKWNVDNLLNFGCVPISRQNPIRLFCSDTSAKEFKKQIEVSQLHLAMLNCSKKLNAKSCPELLLFRYGQKF